MVFLGLSESQWETAKVTNLNIKRYAREYLEYGENKEGYWTMSHFLAQLKRAAKIAEIQYPREQGWRICWVFDNSRIISTGSAYSRTEPGKCENRVSGSLSQWKMAKN